MENLIPQITWRSLRYDFTAIEIHDLSIQLANKTKELNAAEKEKKTISSQQTAKVNEIKATCNKLSNQVADGYEYRDIELTVDYHRPTQGQKILTRKDNNQTIIEKMTDYEWNLFNQPDMESSDMIQEARDNLKGKKRRQRR